MATPTLPIECGICLEEYNSTTRRPRALPCSHNFCGKCLEKSISQGANMCSICRKVHAATSIDEIPINTDLEKFIQMWLLMSQSTINNNDKTEKKSDNGEDFCNGYCPRHSRSLLYFKCRTHKIDICRECTVIHHPSSKCDIIELKDEAMLKKVDMKNNALKAIDKLNSETSSLEIILSETKKSSVRKESDIEKLSKELEEETMICKHAQNSISENISMVTQLHECIKQLEGATTNNNIHKECQETHNKIEAAEKCSQKMEKHLSKLLMKDPESAMTYMRERKIDIYAVDGKGGGMSSKLVLRDGTLQFSSLECNLVHTANSTKILVSSILSDISMQPIVYLDLIGGEKTNKHRRSLGRVRIQLTCSPKKQDQMLELFIGMKGKSFKGSCFETAWNMGKGGEGIGCYAFDAVEFNSDIATDQDQEDPECERHVEGNVTGFVNDANFMICTRTKTNPTTTVPWNLQSGVATINVSAISWTAPKIGFVVSGIEILRKAIRQYTSHDIGPFYNSNISISDTGLEISNSHQQRNSSDFQHFETDVPNYEKSTFAKDNRRGRKTKYISVPYVVKISACKK